MAVQKKRDFFVWSDHEVELLLKVTHDYKTFMAAKNIDWESSLSKYGDILSKFQECYPSSTEARAQAKDFPHKKEEVTKSNLTTKLKNIRSQYRQAVDSGRKCGHGRVVLIYFHECETIWGGSPATFVQAEGVDTDDLECAPLSSDMSSNEPSPSSIAAEEKSTAESRKRRLDDEPGDCRLRKKLTLTSIAQKDLELKRQFYLQQAETDQRFLQSMDRINTNIELLVKHLTQPRQPVSETTPETITTGIKVEECN